MRVIALRDLIRNVPFRWGAQYNRSKQPDKLATGVRLRELDTSRATPADVAAIIGNDSWTNISCDECGARALPAAVEVGREPDYESRTAQLCLSCASRALNLLSEALDTPSIP